MFYTMHRAELKGAYKQCTSEETTWRRTIWCTLATVGAPLQKQHLRQGAPQQKQYLRQGAPQQQQYLRKGAPQQQ